MRYLPIVTILGALTSTAMAAGQVGQVLIVTETAVLKVGDKTVGILGPGNTVVVGAENGDWIWVNYRVGGWIQRRLAAPPASAVEQFSAAIQRAPEQADAYLLRARAWQAQQKWKEALADYDRAVQLAPNNGSCRMARGHAHQRRHDLAAAQRDYDEAIRLNPLDVESYRLRAGLWIDRGEYNKAIDDYNRAVRIAPRDPAISNDRAWLMATCPDAAYRNSEQAIEDATLACRLSEWKAYNRLGTLAAAYAEARNFTEAVRWQRECLELAPADLKPVQQSRLDLYEAHKPFREVGGLWK
jgi:tetratricopeptide (TPR) repeat protein